MCKASLYLGVYKLAKYVKYHILSGKIYTADKNFTRPPVAAVATNFKSVHNAIWDFQFYLLRLRWGDEKVWQKDESVLCSGWRSKYWGIPSCLRLRLRSRGEKQWRTTAARCLLPTFQCAVLRLQFTYIRLEVAQKVVITALRRCLSWEIPFFAVS